MSQPRGISSIGVALAKRLAQSERGRRLIESLRSERPEPRFDGWLTSYFDDQLSDLDAASAGAGTEAYQLFRDLDDDLWTLLLSRSYESYPNIRALLPELPDPSLQRRWNGAAGLELLNQSKGFYVRVKEQVALRAGVALAESSVLDFGCGWGRLTRFFARDVAPGSLFGCDPVEEILDVCRRTRVPATLARCDFVPERLPFREHFDLAFAFSVFTHISEAAHEACLRAIHASLNPNGLLIATVRPPSYLSMSDEMRPLLESLGRDDRAAPPAPQFLFVPHRAQPEHPQYRGGEMTYGEAVINLHYIRERWAPLFELLEVSVPTDDIYQVALTLRRRD